MTGPVYGFGLPGVGEHGAVAGGIAAEEGFQPGLQLRDPDSCLGGQGIDPVEGQILRSHDDANNMGAAMTPAALSTLLTHFDDLGRSPKDYDMIVTGDLGQIGKELLQELALKEGLQLGPRYEDCGCLIFDNIAQDVHAGGSGCGCSAAVLCGSLLDRMQRGELHSLLFCGTGALLSPLSTQQGLPIPGVCHAISILGGEGQ